MLVPEGKVCKTILELYNQCAIVAEPAGHCPCQHLICTRKRLEGKRHLHGQRRE
ncbi:hypothetical protein QNN00_14995 [Bacillus velezensis]|nr:hypothetical protein [Bacillus velezensis]